MLPRLGIAAAVLLVVAALYLLWRRPPRLRSLDLEPIGARGPAIVEFTAPNCAPCRAAVPHLEDASQASGVPFLKVDLGDRPDLARVYGIRTVPTIAVVTRTGRVVGTWTRLPANGEVTAAARSAR